MLSLSLGVQAPGARGDTGGAGGRRGLLGVLTS